MVMKFHRGRLLGKKVPSNYEFKGVKKDGSIIYLEVDAASLNGTGKVRGTRSYLWDITERKMSEMALRDSEEKFRSVVENSLSGIVIINDKFRFTYCNDEACRIIGYSRNEMIEMDFRTLLHEENRDIIIDRYIKRQSGDNVIPRYEFDLIRKNGTKINVEIIANLIEDSKDQVKTICQIQDITERKKADMQIHKNLNNLRKALGGTIKAMATTVEMRDPYTAGHQRRVADLARMIATEMGLSKEKIEGIRLAGVIHDLGKICVPSEILSKPSRLSDFEFGLIKTHPEVGYEILKEIEFPWPIKDIVLQHHERMDGSGYPHGLSREEIIIEARIMAVADVVEAMASHRPYRPALGLEKALEEISNQKGILYDSKVVDTCLKIFATSSYRLEKEMAAAAFS